MIGISTDGDVHQAIRATFENFLDSNVQLENMLGANTIPLTILVDAQVRVLEKVRGAYAWDSRETIAAIGQTFHIKLRR